MAEADLLGFEVGWLNRMGGMGSLPRHDAVLIITHPGGGKSFDYDDYWVGADLIYTGKGRKGDQRRTDANRYVGDNLRTLLVFEEAGSRALRYLLPRVRGEVAGDGPRPGRAPTPRDPVPAQLRCCAAASRRHVRRRRRPGRGRS